jgi:hypothetical protein
VSCLSIQSSLDGVAFEPMTVVECHEIAIAAYQEICAFQESKSHVTTGHELFGWREQRREASDRVEFTLKKRFVGCTPSDMSVRGWRVVSSPRGLAGLYSSSMSLTLKVVQVVDDHNVVMHRVIRSAHTRRTVQTLFLVTRFRAKSGYIILFRSVDRSRLRKLSQHSDTAEGDGVEDKWLDIFTWWVCRVECLGVCEAGVLTAAWTGPSSKRSRATTTSCSSATAAPCTARRPWGRTCGCWRS